MTDEQLMKALAEVARNRADDELSTERLEALAAGTLSEAERRELELELAQSEEGRRARELFAPFDKAFQEQALDRLVQEAAQQGRVAHTVLWRQRLLTRWTLWAGSGMAAAAALLLVWLKPESQPLPEYAVELRGGIQVVRGIAAETACFSAGSRLEVLLRPATAHRAELDVFFFLTRADALLVLSPPIEREPQGSVRMVAVLGKDVRMPPGDWTLCIAYGPLGWAASAEEILQFDTEELQTARGRVERIPIRVVSN